jgi:hypothetical protein
MFIGTLFIIMSIRKQPKGPSIDEWIKNVWNVYAEKYYSAFKKKKVLSLVTK